MRWVIKVGSQLIRDGGPLLIQDWMRQVALLRREEGIEIVWVTSGAIASAMERTAFKKPSKSLPEKQALSAIGQPLIMQQYSMALAAHGLIAAQVLLTYDDIRSRPRSRNLVATLEQLLKWNAIPILNENDAVSTEEIRFGDNDSLSAKVARLIRADRLILLTDVDGLYEADPKKNPHARPIPELKAVTAAWLKRVGGRSSLGTGGMQSKLRAAREANQAGIPTLLTAGNASQVLLKIQKGESHGTWIGR